MYSFFSLLNDYSRLDYENDDHDAYGMTTNGHNHQHLTNSSTRPPHDVGMKYHRLGLPSPRPCASTINHLNMSRRPLQPDGTSPPPNYLNASTRHAIHHNQTYLNKIDLMLLIFRKIFTSSDTAPPQKKQGGDAYMPRFAVAHKASSCCSSAWSIYVR